MWSKFILSKKKNNIKHVKNSDDDYLIDADDKLKPLIITFGGISGGIYQPVFEFKRFLLNNVDCHFIFVKDTNQCWYHKGAIGLGDTIEDLKINLLNMIETINYSKIITIGGSMGGFAALLFGSLIKADGIISFSPQTFIDKNNRKIHNDNRWPNQINNVQKKFDETYFDLSNLNFDNIKVYAIHGKKDKLDKIHSERLKIKNFKISSYYGGHNVVKTIRDNGILIKIINECVES